MSKPRILYMPKHEGELLEWHADDSAEGCWETLEGENNWRRVPDLRAFLRRKGYSVVKVEVREVK